MKMSDNCPNDCKSCPSGCAAERLFAPEKPTPLTADQEILKRQIYDSMKPRSRKFVDRIGYEQWDPFQAPNEPLDMRKEATRRTLQELLEEFMRDKDGASRDPAWRKGAAECALGIMRKDVKYQGVFEFCLWYQQLLQKEGIIP